MAADLPARLRTTPAQLRNFGLQLALIILLLFVALLPWLMTRPLPLWPWPVALLLALVAVLRPTMLGGMHRGFHHLARRLQFINTLLLLTLVWLLLIVPVGTLMKLLGQTRLDRHGNPRTGVNRHLRGQPIKPEEMERPF